MLNCILFSLVPFSVQTSAIASQALTQQQLNKQHQCRKFFEYDIHLLGNHVGNLKRTIIWHTGTINPKATITSKGNVNFLWLKSKYQQTANMHYSPRDQHFVTSSFTQEILGFSARKLTAEISESGISLVSLNNKVTKYQSDKKGEMDRHPLYDLDTLGVQLRLNLLEGKSSFTLYRQASEKIARYQFKVAGEEVITHKKWGQLNTIKVIEIGKYKNTILWFSAKHDYQLVKAKLELIFSTTVWLSNITIQCHADIGSPA